MLRSVANALYIIRIPHRFQISVAHNIIIIIIIIMKQELFQEEQQENVVEAGNIG